MGSKNIRFLTLLLAGSLAACQSANDKDSTESREPGTGPALAAELEESLFQYIVDPWYPRVLDTLHGGYISEFNADWSPGNGSGNKALVQQARHVWATSRLYEAYPEKTEFLDYARHGFIFLKEAMWDRESGGFHAYCRPDGTPVAESLDDKRIYGQAFGIYGLSQYYRVSRDPEALTLAKKAFLWMEEHAHDPVYGGYFEYLHRDGTPLPEPQPGTNSTQSPGQGLKDYNSSIHIMEALTELYSIWPDSLVRVRLEEMFLIIRDTFVDPEGYLRLYFRGDWTHVVSDPGSADPGQARRFLDHYTYGHDVETAFLLLETAHVLGQGEDVLTHRLAKMLVDHSLESGWDSIHGGFFDAGLRTDQGIEIINPHKSWWGLVEGMNALLLMHTLYPEDPHDYYGLFLKAWEHIDRYLIDKTHGGWYNNATDTCPETVKEMKSHIWKTTYHNTRGMLNCIRMLRADEDGHKEPGPESYTLKPQQ